MECNLDGDTLTADVEEVDFEREVLAMEEKVKKAKVHIAAYQVQRNECRNIMSLAILDITHHLPSLNCRNNLTIDMGQNLALPNFEAEQPRDMYYFLPLTVLLFGVVDNVHSEDGKIRMNAYTWQEFEGDQGANNTESCLLMDLKQCGWLQQTNLKGFTYIADNCARQNKNKNIIRFMICLVENKIFP
eukprot:4442375-Ditylum_brightwellii.AAC.1